MSRPPTPPQPASLLKHCVSKPGLNYDTNHLSASQIFREAQLSMLQDSGEGHLRL